MSLEADWKAERERAAVVMAGHELDRDRPARLVVLERSVAALASLVRDEHPDYSLAHIAATWGTDISPEQIDALRLLETEAFDELDNNLVERSDVEAADVPD